MDFSGSEHYDDPEEKGGLGCWGRLALFFLSVVTLALLVVGGILLFFSTDVGRLWALNKINRAIAPAHIIVDKCDVGLFGASELVGVEYSSPEDGLKVVAPRVVFSKGVLAFVPIGKLALGDIKIDSPLITIDSGAVEKKKASKAADRAEQGKTGFFVPIADIGGSLHVNNGAVLVKERERDLFKSDQINGRLLVHSIWKPFGFEVEGRAGHGTVGLTGDLQSVRSLVSAADSDYTDKVVLRLNKVDLAAFTPFLAMMNSPILPRAGVVEGALTVERSENGGLLKAQGGVLIEKTRIIIDEKEDSPAGDVALLVDSEIRDNRCVFRKFEFSSPWGRVNLKGSARREDTIRGVRGDVEADVDVDIAAVIRDFHNALVISDDFKVSKGHLGGYLKMKSSSDGLDLDISLKTSDLTMLYKNRPASIDRDPSLRLKMRLPESALPEIEELRVRASFADIYGRGNIGQGTVKGYVDLSQFYKDFKGLLRSGTALGGAAHFNLATRPSGDNVGFDLITKFSKLNVTTSGIGVSSVRHGSFTCRGNVAGAATVTKGSELSLRDLDYDLRLDESQVRGSVKRFMPAPRGARLPVLRGFSLSADVDIIDLIKAGGAFMKREVYIEALDCQGALLMNAAVESANGVAKARLNGAGKDIVYEMGGRALIDSDPRFGGAVTFDARHNTINLADVELSSDIADIKMPEWFVQLPADGRELEFEGTADMLFDAGLLYALFSDKKNRYDQIRGDLKLGLTAAGDDDGANVDLNAALTDFCMLSDGEIMFYEKQAQLNSVLNFNREGDDVVVKSLEFYSSLIDLTTKGAARDLWKKRVVDFNGDMDLKFDALNRMLKVRGVDEWKLAGHKKCPFKLKAPLSSLFWRNGSFSGAAYIASLEGFGLSAGGAEISVDMRQGRLSCDWRPSLNGGRLRFSPILDFSARGATLLMPAGARLLERVEITQEMVDKLLVLLNPMLKGSLVRRGFISLKINSFSSGAKPGYADLNIDARAELEDIRLTLSPAMRELLRMINVKSSTYQVKRLPMHVVVRDERVYLDPFTMVFSRQPVTFSGSVGFDSSIDYLIEIPIGETLAQKSALKLPKELAVKVKVTGTVDNPRLDTSALKKTVGNFIKNTLGDEAVKGVTDLLDQLRREIKK